MKKNILLNTLGLLMAVTHSYANAAGGAVVMSIDFVGAASSNHPVASAQSVYSTLLKEVNKTYFRGLFVYYKRLGEVVTYWGLPLK